MHSVAAAVSAAFTRTHTLVYQLSIAIKEIRALALVLNPLLWQLSTSLFSTSCPSLLIKSISSMHFKFVLFEDNFN